MPPKLKCVHRMRQLAKTIDPHRLNFQTFTLLLRTDTRHVLSKLLCETLNLLTQFMQFLTEYFSTNSLTTCIGHRMAQSGNFIQTTCLYLLNPLTQSGNMRIQIPMKLLLKA